MEENKYKAALERVKEKYFNKEYKLNEAALVKEIFEEIFFELDGNKDERIRKAIIAHMNLVKSVNGVDVSDILAYLEKVKDFDEQLEEAYKTADEVQYKRGYDDGYLEGIGNAKKELEKQGAIKDGSSIDHHAKPITTTETKYPKFKIGDWVVDEEDNHVYQVKRVVTNVSSGMSSYDLSDGGYFYSTKTNCHLWSIADAQDGDILSNGKMIVIFKHFEEPSYRQQIVAYIGLDNSGHIQVTDGLWELGIDKAKPATKEQRELLFRKMEEAGYIWNATTKELSQLSVNKISDKVWSEVDEIKLEEAICVNEANGNWVRSEDAVKGISNWLKSIKERMRPQPKWSKEDKEMKDLIDEISCNNDDVDYETHVRIMRWLNELKQRLS